MPGAWRPSSFEASFLAWQAGASGAVFATEAVVAAAVGAVSWQRFAVHCGDAVAWRGMAAPLWAGRRRRTEAAWRYRFVGGTPLWAGCRCGFVLRFSDVSA